MASGEELKDVMRRYPTGVAVVTVDLEGDGTPSLFGANHQENKVELWRNTTPRGKPALD